MEEFKKGDYIVCLPEAKDNPDGAGSSDKGGSGFEANFCFKISDINMYDTFNVLWKEKGGLGIYDNSVRRATLEEIAEYKRLGRPYDVTTLEKKYDYEVVHCTTQEQWDFVSNKLNYNFYGNWFNHEHYGKGQSFCIDINAENNSNTLTHYKDQNSLIYTFQEWCEKFGHTFKETPKLEKGKWYKCQWIWLGNNNKTLYFKVELAKNGFIDSTYWITCWNNSLEKNGTFRTKEISEITEVSIEEIQQYLPEGHPDKVNEKDYYYTDDVIVFGTPNHNMSTIYGNGIRISCAVFARSNNFVAVKNCPIRKATEEEKQWLDACAKAGKFIPKEEALKKSEPEEKSDTPILDAYNKAYKNASQHFVIHDPLRVIIGHTHDGSIIHEEVPLRNDSSRDFHWHTEPETTQPLLLKKKTKKPLITTKVIIKNINLVTNKK